MKDVIGVIFNNPRIYYFDPAGEKYERGSKVIVETERGLQLGTIDTDIISLKKDQIKGDLKKVIRKASHKDEEKYERNLKDAEEALEKCREIATGYELDMNVIDASFTFDRNQLLFHFLSVDRVDFRDLAKDLANIYKTRIELRQVGIRDKAACVGGIGVCGRIVCCNSFLDEFDSITINMAKNQNLSLNPSKINGVCGRLLCCLKYENENYIEYKKGLPDVGSKIETENGIGKVISVDVFKRKYKVLVDDNQIMEVEVGNESKK